MNRRGFLHLLSACPFFDAIRRWFAPPPDVVKAPAIIDVSDPLETCYPDWRMMTRDDLLTALRNEIHDVRALEDHASRAYMWMTNDRISKAMTRPDSVIALAEEIRAEEFDDCILDAIKPYVQECADLSDEINDLRQRLLERS